MEEIFNQLLLQISATSWLEVIATIFGLASVWYSKKENILVYPTGIISVSIAIYLTFGVGLYAEAGINAYYFVMSVYGWYYWLNADINRPQVAITQCNLKEHAFALGSTVIVFILIRSGLSFTDSSVPILDALTTSTAITGMWLMARKKIENWIYWVVTDLIATPLYFHKGLYFFSLQFFIFTALALWGYFSWKKVMASSIIK